METTRHIGIDLHRNKFTCCLRVENGRSYLSEWKLEDLPRFVKKLRSTDISFRRECVHLCPGEVSFLLL